MNFSRKLTLDRKIIGGFGIVTILLSLLTIWSYLGIGSIAGSTSIVISGNQLDKFLVEKEIDHLNWLKI